VTLNDGSDWDDHTALLNYGFSTYPLRIFAVPEETVVTLPVISGQRSDVGLAVETALLYPLTGAEYKTAAAAVVAPRFVYACVEQGQIAGFMVLSVDGKETAAVNLLFDSTAAQMPPRRMSLWEWIFGIQ
jgi:D-alanyl-D-alanine carboxypeptidase